MKYNYVVSILVILLICNQHGFTQDRVVLNSGDTLNCIISKETKSYLYIEQNVKGINTVGKIPKQDIQEWTIVPQNESFSKEDIVASDNKTIADLVEVVRDTSKSLSSGKIRASLSGGVGYLLASTKEAKENLESMGVSSQIADDYYKQLKLGSQIKASLYFYLYKDYWLGGLYNGFYSTAEVTTSIQMGDGNMYYGELSERYFVNFAGLSFYSARRYGKQQKIGFNSSLTLGPAFYRNEAKMLNEQVLIKGTTLGMNTTLGFAYYIKPHLCLSADAGLFFANLKKLNIETVSNTQEVKLDKENYENLSRFDFSVGLVYYW